MHTQFFKVLSQTEAVTITRQDGTFTQKSTVVLQELGGKYENSYAAVLMGNQVVFTPGDIVFGCLRFTIHEYNGQQYQDVTISEIQSLTARAF